jgi:hypothetical protein
MLDGMARLEIQGDRLVVCLSVGEKFAAVALRRPKARLSAVRSARVVPHPFEELRGIRAPGLRVPGSIALGTWRSRRGRDFVAVYRGRPAVIVELEGARYRRFVVSVIDPAAVVAAISAQPPA